MDDGYPTGLSKDELLKSLCKIPFFLLNTRREPLPHGLKMQRRHHQSRNQTGLQGKIRQAQGPQEPLQGPQAGRPGDDARR